MREIFGSSPWYHKTHFLSIQLVKKTFLFLSHTIISTINATRFLCTMTKTKNIFCSKSKQSNELHITARRSRCNITFAAAKISRCRRLHITQNRQKTHICRKRTLTENVHLQKMYTYRKRTLTENAHLQKMYTYRNRKKPIRKSIRIGFFTVL